MRNLILFICGVIMLALFLLWPVLMFLPATRKPALITPEPIKAYALPSGMRVDEGKNFRIYAIIPSEGEANTLCYYVNGDAHCKNAIPTPSVP